MNDYNNQNRIILGGPNDSLLMVEGIFKNVFPGVQIIKTDSTTAETVKYVTNAFLAVKVSFANEMYKLSEKLNVDYDKLVEYVIFDKRLGPSHWNVPSDGDFGFGGHCFPKDLIALINLTDKHKTLNNLLKATIETNDKVRNKRDWENMRGRSVN